MPNGKQGEENAAEVKVEET